jgi:hypothetical protein
LLRQGGGHEGGAVGTGLLLVYPKPRPTGVLGEGVVGAAAAGAAAGGEGGGEDDALGEEEVLLTPEELDTRGRQQVRR